MYGVMRTISDFLQSKAGIKVTPPKFGKQKHRRDNNNQNEQGITAEDIKKISNRKPNTTLGASLLQYEETIKPDGKPEQFEKPISEIQEAVYHDFLRYTTSFTLPNGTDVYIRPLLPNDKLRMKEVLEQGLITQKSLNFRFNSVMQKVSESALDYLTSIDYDRHVAFGVMAKIDGEWKGVGTVRLIQDEIDPSIAEWAAIVMDRYHGERIGSCLLYYLSYLAAHLGIKQLCAVIHPENFPVLHWMKKLEAQRQQRNGCSYWVYDTPIDPSWIHSPEIREKLQVAAIGTSTDLPEEVIENVKQSLQKLKDFHTIPPSTTTATSLYTNPTKNPKVTYIVKSSAIELDSELDLGELF